MTLVFHNRSLKANTDQRQHNHDCERYTRQVILIVSFEQRKFYQLLDMLVVDRGDLILVIEHNDKPNVVLGCDCLGTPLRKSNKI